MIPMQKVLLEKENSQVAKYGLIVLRTWRVTRRSWGPGWNQRANALSCLGLWARVSAQSRSPVSLPWNAACPARRSVHLHRHEPAPLPPRFLHLLLAAPAGAAVANEAGEESDGRGQPDADQQGVLESVQNWKRKAESLDITEKLRHPLHFCLPKKEKIPHYSVRDRLIISERNYTNYPSWFSSSQVWKIGLSVSPFPLHPNSSSIISEPWRGWKHQKSPGVR